MIPNDLLIVPKDLLIVPIDLLIVPNDLLIIPIDLLIIPIDLLIIPIDLLIVPNDLLIVPIDLPPCLHDLTNAAGYDSTKISFGDGCPSPDRSENPYGAGVRPHKIVADSRNSS